MKNIKANIKHILAERKQRLEEYHSRNWSVLVEWENETVRSWEEILELANQSDNKYDLLHKITDSLAQIEKEINWNDTLNIRKNQNRINPYEFMYTYLMYIGK